MRLKTFMQTVAALACLAAIPALAARSVVNTGESGNVAIRGTDSVAYFSLGRAVPGSPDFQASWHGAVWYFASAMNRDLFAADPERYAPRYGGYCAYALARGELSDIDPAAFTIHGGKLYLHCSDKARDAWLEDPDGYIAKADALWPGVLAR